MSVDIHNDVMLYLTNDTFLFTFIYIHCFISLIFPPSPSHSLSLSLSLSLLFPQVSQLEQVFVRGSMIRFLIVPDMLKNAPMFKPKSGAKGLAAGAGKSAMIRAQGNF